MNELGWTVNLKPLKHPGVWTKRESGGAESFIIELKSSQVDSLRQFIRQLLKAQPVVCGSLDLTACAGLLPELQAWQREVLSGKGLVILRGFPVESFSARERDFLFWYIGSQFGAPLPQNMRGDLLGRVEDLQGDGPEARGYQSRKELKLHTDRGDIVCLLCVRPATSGGLTRFCSLYTIFNELLILAPDVLPVLFRGFQYDFPYNKGAVTDYRVPVFSMEQGVLSGHYVRAFIECAADSLNKPLNENELSALEYFESIANRHDICHEIQLKAGDLAIWNNHTLLHGRTSFVNQEEVSVSQRRLMLRLWLSVGNEWPLSSVLEMHKRTQL